MTLIKEGLKQLKLENYKNSTEIVDGITVEDLVKAGLMAKLNMFFISETGEGKTQLENDILGLFGNKGFFEQGRNDLTIKEMFTRFNLQKLKSAKTTEDIKEVTEQVNHPIYIVDELTRCIPAVQNQFFNLFDGFITVDGTKIKLGHQGYSIGIASGNVGNGRYVGTSETDRALLDRMHLIVDLDYFPAKSTDTLDILIAKKDPRVSDATANDMTETIVKMNKAFQDEIPTLMQYTAALYFVHGLDYLENVPGNSKRKNKNAWPGIVTNHAKGSDAALIFPFSKRAAISTLTLAKALELVREAKDNKYEDIFEPVFDAAYLIGAQSGVLHPAAIDTHYNCNPYEAMEAVIAGIRTEFSNQVETLHQAISQAQKGKLAHLDKFSGRWEYMKDILQRASGKIKAKQK